MFDMVSRPAVLSAALLAVWVPSQATTIEPVDINVGSVASGDGIFQVLLPRDSRAMSLSPLGKWKQFMPGIGEWRLQDAAPRALDFKALWHLRGATDFGRWRHYTLISAGGHEVLMRREIWTGETGKEIQPEKTGFAMTFPGGMVYGEVEESVVRDLRALQKKPFTEHVAGAAVQVFEEFLSRTPTLDPTLDVPGEGGTATRFEFDQGKLLGAVRRARGEWKGRGASRISASVEIPKEGARFPDDLEKSAIRAFLNTGVAKHLSGTITVLPIKNLVGLGQVQGFKRALVEIGFDRARLGLGTPALEEFKTAIEALAGGDLNIFAKNVSVIFIGGFDKNLETLARLYAFEGPTGARVYFFAYSDRLTPWRRQGNRSRRG